MKNEKLVEKALKILQEKSKNALELAERTILEELNKNAERAVKYYFKNWNDTTRPGVLSLACEVVGGNIDEVISLQVALVYIAAAMDIHDDIIDKSVTKGANKTVYGKFGEEKALLLGNAFLVKGFTQLYKELEKLPHEKRMLILDITKNFLLDVIEAHMLEIELRNKKWEVKPEEYIRMLEKKASDLEGRMRIGAIFGGGSLQEVEALGKYGRSLGILLAARSDFVDIFENDELINRVKHECLPLPIIYALQNSAIAKNIQQILKREKVGEDDVNELIEIIYDTTELSALRHYLNEKQKLGLAELKYLKRNKIRKELAILISSTLEDL